MNEFDVREMLEEEIAKRIEAISLLPDGSEEQAIAIDNLAKLYKLKIEDDKVHLDYTERYDARMQDAELKKSQMDDKTDRYIKIGADIVIPVATLMFYGIWMNKGFKFEESGSISSTTFRNLIGRFRPTK
jgi:hypothetical protein